MTDALFSPFKLKNFTLKNRLGLAPMTRISGGDDCIPRHDVLDFLLTRAKMDAFNTGHTMAALTRERTSLPLMICGKIHDRKSAADALKDADIVLSGKTSLLNPDWVEDFRAGKEMPAHKSEDANVAYTPTPLP